MTANIAKFFRHAPAVSLEKYFLKFPSARLPTKI